MKISEAKREKIIEQILALLFSNSPKSLFTSYIAKEIARDEEFIKEILFNLKKRNLITLINKNSEGKMYKRRARWTLSDEVYKIYKEKASKI